MPDARLLVLLRDPVQRAYSHFQHNRRRGLETLGFSDALAAEPERLLEGNWDERRSSVQVYSYRARGRYAEQLRRWYELFDPSQIHVLQSESLFADPVAVTDHVLGWLGAATPGHGLEAEPANVGAYPTAIDEEAAAELSAYFDPLNEELFDLIGKRFDWKS